MARKLFERDGGASVGATAAAHSPGFVARGKTIVRFCFNIRDLGKHSIKLLAAATRGAFADVAVRIEDGDLLGEGRCDELVQRNAILLRESLRPAAKRFGDVDAERAYGMERILRNSSGVIARIPSESAPRKCRVLRVMMKGALAARASSSTRSSLGSGKWGRQRKWMRHSMHCERK
jgi:hypothetical protein